MRGRTGWLSEVACGPAEKRDPAVYFYLYFPGLFSGPLSYQLFSHNYVVMLFSGCRKGEKIRLNSQEMFTLSLAEKQTFVQEGVKASAKVTIVGALAPLRVYRGQAAAPHLIKRAGETEP